MAIAPSLHCSSLLAVSLACVLPTACGGQAGSPGDAGTSLDAEHRADASDGAAPDACVTGAAPTYDCDAGVVDGGGCPPFGESDSGALYPVGCQVTTGPMQTTFGCTPLTCTCMQIPGSSGGVNYGFTCPL